MCSETQAKSIPTLDLGKEELKPGTETWVLSCKDARQALEEFGCFMAVYDRLSSQLLNSIFEVVEELFDLPTEIKIQNTNPKPFHGYLGQIPSLSLYESLAIDNPTQLEGLQSFAKLMWPQGNHRFCESLNSFAKVVAGLEKMVTRMIHDSYGVGRSDCESNMKATTYNLRCFGYKVSAEGDKISSKMGLDAHTDMTFVSVVYQHQIGGLQIKSMEGQWIDVQPSQCSFLVLAGDALMAWSNERIRSCTHRVIISELKPRYSLGLFTYKNGTISVPDELVDDEHPLRYKPFDHFDFLRFHKASNSSTSGVLSSLKDYCGLHF